jgi:Endonuclease/Exonuclease/phosphatase family
MPFRIIIKTFLLLVFSNPIHLSAQTKDYSIYTIAFYNVENLFDTIDDPVTIDEDFTPLGKNKYNSRTYRQKLNQLGMVIHKLGADLAKSPPVLIGLTEIENATVLEDLLKTEELIRYPYEIIHFDSPDLRGIDVGLLYLSDIFKPVHQEKLEVKIWDQYGNRIYTRDILMVSGILDDEEVHLFINHWPSRRGGEKISENNRKKAAFVLQKAMQLLRDENPFAKIIVMGDFNDNPTDKSIKEGLLCKSKMEEINANELYNPMEAMYKTGLNTLAFRDGLHLFDQIMVSAGLLSTNSATASLFFYKAGIFNPEFITTSTGKFKGYPYRSFSNNQFSQGYSDHYPVYCFLLKGGDQ